MTPEAILLWADLLARVIPLAVDLAGALRRLVAGEDPPTLVEEYARKSEAFVETIAELRLEAYTLQSSLAAASLEATGLAAEEHAEDTMEKLTTASTVLEWLDDWSRRRSAQLLRGIGPDERKALATDLTEAFAMRLREGFG